MTTDAETIRPALTDDEWTEKARPLVVKLHNGRLIVWGDHDEYAVSSVRLDTPEQMHAVAAMALYGQPFGLTMAMANACEFAAIRCDEIVAADPDARGPALDAVTLRQTAACIRALLPPPQPNEWGTISVASGWTVEGGGKLVLRGPPSTVEPK